MDFNQDALSFKQHDLYPSMEGVNRVAVKEPEPAMTRGRFSISSLHLLVLIGLLSIGCLKPSTKGASKKSDGKSQPPQAVDMTQGSLTAYSLKPPRLPIYSVSWQKAAIKSPQPAQFTALADGVTGYLMKDGLPVCQFTADHAMVDRQQGLLKLFGTVVIKQVQMGTGTGTALNCNTVKYTEANRIIMAQGNVQVISNQFSLGTLPEIWVTPDFKKMGSPDSFSPVIHNSN